MSSQTIINCPKCGQQVDTDSRFCKHCAFDLVQSAQPSQAQAIPVEGSVATSTVPQERFKFVKALMVGVAWLLYLPIAGVLIAQVLRQLRVNKIMVFESEEMVAAVVSVISSLIIFPILIFVKRKSFFEKEIVSIPQYAPSHHLSPTPQSAASLGQRNNTIKILGTLGGLGLLAVLGLGGFVWYMVQKANDDRIVFESSSSTSPSSSSSSSTSYTGSLTNEVVRRTLQRWDSQAGIEVVGVQELPQQNAAVAQMNITNLYYRADGGANRREYSGPAEAQFTHYNDGRWVLTRVTIGRGLDSVRFNNLSVEAR